MKRIYVNEEWCLGCHLCEYNCAFAETGERDMVQALMGKSIAPRISVTANDKITFAVSCRHCDDALCVKSCIAGAISKENGVVVIDKDKCVGCYTCVSVCPFGAVLPTHEGPVRKCELCQDTPSKTPRCVQSCPNGAIVFEER